MFSFGLEFFCLRERNVKFSCGRVVFAYYSPTQFCMPKGLNRNLTSCCFFQWEHNLLATLSSYSLFLFPKLLWKYLEVCYSCWAHLMNCMCLNHQSQGIVDFIFHLSIFFSRWWNGRFSTKTVASIAQGMLVCYKNSYYMQFI